MKVTTSNIKSLPNGRHTAGSGLVLHVRGVSKSWTGRVTISGQRTEIALGTYPAIDLAGAQALAAEAKAKAKQGIDIRIERAQAALAAELEAAKQITVAKAIDGAFNAKKASLKGAGTAGRWMSPLEVHVLPKIGHLQMSDLTQHDLVKIIKPIWRTKTSAAQKCVDRIGFAVKYALAHDVPVMPELMAKTKAILGDQGHTVEHHPAMPWMDVPAFYAGLGDNTAEMALKLTILTASRQAPVRFAKIGQFDLDAGTWTIPGEMMKGKKGKTPDFVIPLSPEAAKIAARAIALAGSDDLDAWIFSARNGNAISDAAMTKVLRTRGFPAGSVSVHGFRSSFKDWAIDTGQDWVSSEMALAHKIGTSVQQAYARSDNLAGRSVLMNAWADHIKPLPLTDQGDAA